MVYRTCAAGVAMICSMTTTFCSGNIQYVAYINDDQLKLLEYNVSSDVITMCYNNNDTLQPLYKALWYFPSFSDATVSPF